MDIDNSLYRQEYVMTIFINFWMEFFFETSHRICYHGKQIDILEFQKSFDTNCGVCFP